MYDPCAALLVADEEERNVLCNNVELSEIQEDNPKKHFYPKVSPAQFSPTVLPISPV